MPKKYFFYLIGLMLLLIGGIYGFTKWSETKEKVNLWTLVPEDAVFIVESANHDELLDKIRESDYWDNLMTVRSVEALQENITLLDSLSDRNEGSSRFLKRKTVLTSVHVTSKTDFDFVFYIPVNTVGEHRFVRTLVENIGKSGAFEEKTQIYQNYQITSITNRRNQDTFSYFSYHNNLVISANQELIKEIIRKVNRGQLESPAVEYQNINYLNQPDVYAQIFINYRHLPQFLGTFLKKELQPDINFLASLCRTSMLGLKQQRGQFLVNGFSNPEHLSDSFYNHIKEQAPQFFDIRKYLPSRIALLLHFGLNQIPAIRQLYPQDKNISWPVPQMVLADSLSRTFRQELAVGFLEANNNYSNSEKVIFARSANPAVTTALINTIISQTSNGSRISSQEYEGYTISAVPVAQFPMLLFGSIARGFEQCYIAQVADYTLFAPDAATLRSVLSDIKASRVWSEVENQKFLLEHTQQETNFSLYLNTSLAWKMLDRYVQEQQRSNLLRQEILIKKLFSQVALQFSRKGDQYYTSFLFTHPQIVPESQVSKEVFELQHKVDFKEPLISPPLQAYASTGIAAGSDIFVQDSAFALHRVSANGQVIWSDSLEEAIVSPIYQVTFGLDTQPKFLFAAGNHIYCLNQSGRNVENFPFILPDTVQISHLSVFNLSSKEDYRLLVADKAGRLSMFDQEGNPQTGWYPKILESSLATAPINLKINGKDVILVLQQNGFIYAFNIQGQIYPGFPLALDAALASGVFTQAGSSFRTSRVTVISQDGKKFTFDLSGRIVQRQQIPRLSRRSVFELVPEPEGKSYIVTRQEPGKISIYDQNQKLLLEKNFITSSRKLVQYFDFGPLHRIYALTETGPRKTYLYNYKAQLIGQKPLDNRLPVTLRYRNNAQVYSLFITADNEVQNIFFRDK